MYCIHGYHEVLTFIALDQSIFAQDTLHGDSHLDEVQMRRATEEKEENLQVQIVKRKLIGLDYFSKVAHRKNRNLAGYGRHSDGDTVHHAYRLKPAELLADLPPRLIVLVHVDLDGLEPEHDVDEQDEVQSADEGPDVEEDTSRHRFDTVVKAESGRRNI